MEKTNTYLSSRIDTVRKNWSQSSCKKRKHIEHVYLYFRTPSLCQGSRFKVQGSLLFVTYTIIQGIIGSEMLVRTGPLNGKCKKEKIKHDNKIKIT